MTEPLTAASTTVLRHPPGSYVSTQELLQEVDEYFAAGVKVKPGDVVVDVGANIGAFALRVAERCRGDVSIFGFEPCPETYAALASNFRSIPLLLRTRHRLRQIGLTDHEHAGQSITFHHFRRFPTNSTFDLAAKRREFEIFFEDRGRRIADRIRPLLPRVADAVTRASSSLPKGPIAWWAIGRVMGLEESAARLESLDTMLRADGIERVDVLKVDVEGHELDVLQGLGPETWPLVRQVVLETHNRDGRLDRIEALLRGHGFSHVVSRPQTTVDNGLDSVMLYGAR